MRMNWEALQVEILLRVLAAGSADGDGIHLEFLAAELLVDLDLDGETVTIPAGNVGRVESGHGLGLDDEVLEGLIERVAEVGLRRWRRAVRRAGHNASCRPMHGVSVRRDLTSPRWRGGAVR